MLHKTNEPKSWSSYGERTGDCGSGNKGYSFFMPASTSLVKSEKVVPSWHHNLAFRDACQK